MSTLPVFSLLLSAAVAGPPPEVEEWSCTGEDARSELKRLAKADQKDRKNWHPDMEARDAERLQTVRKLIETQQICSGKSAYAAGVILQHSPKRADFELAHRLFAFAASQGVRGADLWATLAWDRYLVSGGEPQWFGSQRRGVHADDGSFVSACLVAVDPAATDADRAAAGAYPIAEVVASIYEANSREVPANPTLAGLAEDGFVCEPIAYGE